MGLLNENNFNFEDLKVIPEWNEERIKPKDEMIIISHLRKQLQEMMSDFVGIVKSNKHLNKELQKQQEIAASIDEIYQYSILSPQLSELRNLTTVAYLIITQSMEMKENKGVFYNKDLA